MIKIICNKKSKYKEDSFIVASYYPPFNFEFDLLYILSEKYWFAFLLSVIAHELTHFFHFVFKCKLNFELYMYFHDHTSLDKREFWPKKIQQFVYKLLGGK